MNEIIPPAKHMLDATYNALIGPWMQNFAINLPKIRKGLNLQNLQKKEGEPCILIGGGPSLTRYKHLQKIKKACWKHPVLCCDKVISDCLSHGIKPYITASVDGNPVIAEYYQDKTVKKASRILNAAFSITVHPKTVKAWKGKIWWFTAMLDSIEKDEEHDLLLQKFLEIDVTEPDALIKFVKLQQKILTRTPKRQLNRHSNSYLLHLLSGGKGLISAVGNVGSFLWNLAADLGCSPIILTGYDFSEQVRDKADAVYFMKYAMMFHKKGGLSWEDAQDKAALLHQVETNPDFNTHYLVNPIWKSYREQLKAHIITSKIHTINATGNGCLHTKAIPVHTFEATTLESVLNRYN